MSDEQHHRIPSSWYTRAAIIVLAIGLAVAFYLVIEESRRAQKAECEAVNKSVDAIRLAVIDVAGFQSKIDPNADATLRRQIITSNARRRAFAEEKAAGIPGLDCANPRDVTSSSSSSTTTTIPPPTRSTSP